MAVSGSINYTQTAGNIVKDSLILLGVAHPEETITSDTENYCVDVLNKMIKSWSGRGLNMWAVEEAVLIFDNDITKYDFADKSGNGGDTGVCVRSSGLVQTTFSAAEASGQTILSVTSSTGMTAGDVIMLELDDGSRDDTTIVSVDSATQVTVTDALSGGAASGNYIYSYTASDVIDHPVSVMNVRLNDSSGNETPMVRLSRQEYQELPSKTTEGRPYAYYFHKVEAQSNISTSNPVMHVYLEPSSLQEYMVFDVVKAIDDIDATSNNVYFPDEWLEAITYNLSVRLASAFGKEAKLQVIAPLAAQFYDDAIRSDGEDSTINFTPDIMY